MISDFFRTSFLRLSKIMSDYLKDLISVSRLYGNDPEYVIAGGGNTSYKTRDKIWVKASGTSMGEIDEDGFVCLDRNKLKVLISKEYSSSPAKREEEVKTDLQNAILYPADKRPSVETSMHEVIPFSYVVHTHPALVNGILCAQDSQKLVSELFDEDAFIYVEYTDPGYVLFKRVYDALLNFRKEKNRDPNIIFLENHGVFVSADSVNRVMQLYDKIGKTISPLVKATPDTEAEQVPEELLQSAEMLKKQLGEGSLSAIADTSPLVQYFVKSPEFFSLVSKPFTPDNIVYCKSNYLFVEKSEELLQSVEKFKVSIGYYPKVIGIEGSGLLVIEQNCKSARIVLDVFKDMMKVAWYAAHFGGPRHLNQKQIDFIDNWEVENYRRQMSKKE